MQFQHSKGQLVNLLRVAVEPSLDQGTRQAAAITFKNLVRRDWVAGMFFTLDSCPSLIMVPIQSSSTPCVVLRVAAVSCVARDETA